MQKSSNCNIYFTCYCHVCASSKYASQMPHIQISSYALWQRYVSLNTSYDLTSITNVTRSTSIHNFTLLVYAQEQIYLPHVPVYYYCSLHTDFTYIIKNNTGQLLTTMLLLSICQQQTCPIPAIDLPHALIMQCVLMGEVCQ